MHTETIREFADENDADRDEYKKILEQSYFDKKNPNDKYELTKISEIYNNALNDTYMWVFFRYNVRLEHFFEFQSKILEKG